MGDRRCLKALHFVRGKCGLCEQWVRPVAALVGGERDRLVVVRGFWKGMKGWNGFGRYRLVLRIVV